MSLWLHVLGICLLLHRPTCLARSLRGRLIDAGFVSQIHIRTLIPERTVSTTPSGYGETHTPDNARFFLAAEGLGRESTIIAFSAYMSSQRTFRNHEIIRFDTVLLNDGDGYNKATGIFRAPSPGDYSFSINFPPRLIRNFEVNLMVDGKPITEMNNEGHISYFGTQDYNTVEVRLNKWTPVWLESNGNKQTFESMSFTGKLLYSTEK